MKKILILMMLLILGITCSCSNNTISSDPWEDEINQNVITQDVITGDVINQEKLNQVISSQVYLKEVVVIQDKISETLIQEDKIKEVVLCKTIYVPQESINEFSEHSQTDAMFGDDVELAPVLTKVAIGTGVIITLAVLKVATNGMDTLFASVVAAAAPAAIQGAAIGTLVGGMTGGLTGGADEIDETGRTSAIIGFSAATAGFIIATVSAVLAFPSGGSTAAGVAFGVKVAIAGISLINAVNQGVNMVKTLKTTDAAEIDWNNVNWNEVGVSAAEQAINYGADGYMWGSIIGAVEGGLQGYQYYETHGTAYSSYKARIDRTPSTDSDRGYWTGERGESTFVLNEPITCKNGTVVSEITYKNGVPDFSPHALRQVKIKSMTDNRSSNFKQADEVLAEYWSKIKYEGHKWSARDVQNYRTSNGLTWHEMNNMQTMQLVPTEVNATWGHLGGVGEYNAMIGQQGGSYFD